MNNNNNDDLIPSPITPLLFPWVVALWNDVPVYSIRWMNDCRHRWIITAMCLQALPRLACHQETWRHRTMQQCSVSSGNGKVQAVSWLRYQDNPLASCQPGGLPSRIGESGSLMETDSYFFCSSASLSFHRPLLYPIGCLPKGMG